MANKILVISGHPNLAISHANKTILQELEKSKLNLEIRDLGALYPYKPIDVPAEQAALIKANTVVLQFPFHWYSVPSPLTRWIEDVIVYNFAYGPEGDKLKGKNFLLSFTTGGPADAYTPLGYNHFTVAEFIKPLQQTCYLISMNFLEPIYSQGMNTAKGEEAVIKKAKEHASRLIKTLEKLS
ncbi:General stress protein 14 [Candidatus Hepatincola sp. Pdp]